MYKEAPGCRPSPREVASIIWHALPRLDHELERTHHRVAKRGRYLQHRAGGSLTTSTQPEIGRVRNTCQPG